MSSDAARNVSIDINNLHEEARTLPSYMQAYHEMIQELREEYIELKYRLETDSAAARRDIRKRLSSSEGKYTIDAVNDELSCMPSIISLKKKMDKIDNDIRYYNGVLSSLDAKRSSLNNLVSLFIKDYYRDDIDTGRYRHADIVKGRMDADSYEDEQTKKLKDAMMANRRK